MSVEELLVIKDELDEGHYNNNLIKIVPYLLDYNILVFDCNNNDLNMIEYMCNNVDNYIYVLKYLDKTDTLI